MPKWTRRHLHPANRARHDERGFGSRAADAVTSYMGSWRFIGVQSVVIAAWIVLNTFAVFLRWDPYPWILLNLVFSTQAAFASPLILLAQNQSAEHDRLRAEIDYRTNTAALEILQQIHSGQVRICRSGVELVKDAEKDR
jgi:uncharacterized membrane protein